MSDDRYYTRLRFSGRHGIAKGHGGRADLYIAPDLGDGPVQAMIYTPEIDEAQVWRNAEAAWDRMTQDEIRAADALIERLCKLEWKCSWHDEANHGGTLCGD